jgi:hypothetical protein
VVNTNTDDDVERVFDRAAELSDSFSRTTWRIFQIYLSGRAAAYAMIIMNWISRCIE